MKKKFIPLLLLLGASTVVLGQVVADSSNIILGYGSGMTVLDFLKANAWGLSAMAFVLLYDGWLAQTGKIKAGSVLSLILNWIGKYLFGKAGFMATKKASFMSAEELEKQLAITKRKVKNTKK